VGFAGVLAVLGVLLAAVPQPAVSQRVLAIPWHHQEHNLSCEAAALQMALSYYGIKVDELALIASMTDDRRPALFDSAGHLERWGDPAKAYVGNPDGNIQRYTGYGAYFQPVAAAAVRAGAAVERAGSGLYGPAVPASALYQAILDGHPAVTWISNTYHQVPLGSYVAYDGATMRYTLTEHAVTLIGVKPGWVLIDDPWFGKAWHRRSQFESAYRTFAGMAVVLAQG
jgi:uncharacterized protein YvpB